MERVEYVIHNSWKQLFTCNSCLETTTSTIKTVGYHRRWRRQCLLCREPWRRI